MRNKNIKVGAFIVLVSMGLVACNPLKKMAKNAELVEYTVTPNPLEMHGDSIEISISGKYPAKYFHKKATAIVTPTMVWEGGQKEFKAVTLIGEAAEGEGTKISATGGSFTYNDKIAYVKGMEDCDVMVKAVGGFKTKTKDFTEKKIGDGTIITPLLIQSDEKPILAKDKFIKTIPHSFDDAEINYLIQSAQVRYSELKQDDYKAMIAFLEEGIAKEFTWKGVTISSYASPDGELSKNENLANDRSKAAAKTLAKSFKKAKIEAAKEEGFFNTIGKGEDWAGFEKAVGKTTHEDKDLILRVLKMTSDLEKREQEIKNMSATYDFLRKDVLPKLRRSQISITAEEKSKSDDEIKNLAATAPDSLNVEELLYAATLTNDAKEKLSIYQSCAKIFPNEWRGHNNVGYLLLIENKTDDAKKSFDMANKANANNPIVNNNLGIIARWNGDIEKAKEYYNNANGAGNEVSYNKSIIAIMEGNYASATSNAGSEKTFNAALAHLLNGNAAGSIKIIDASDAKDTAEGYYLKAIAGARTGDNSTVISNLKSAIAKDGSLKSKAAKDAEFLKLREEESFKAVVQ